MREQIRVSSLTNWLLLELRNEMQAGNIVSGQQLASQIRGEYDPLLNNQYQAIMPAQEGNDNGFKTHRKSCIGTYMAPIDAVDANL